MKIDRITLRRINIPFRSGHRTSSVNITGLDRILVSVQAGGLTGWGECIALPDPYYNSETVDTEWLIAKKYLIPKLVGNSFASVTDLTATWKQIRGHQIAKCGIESAFWDLLAQSSGQSLSQILGGTRDRVSVGVSLGIHEKMTETISLAERFLTEGYARIKFKISPGRDLDLVRAARAAFPAAQLQADANGSYDRAQFDIFEQMDDCELQLIEQPLGIDDLLGHSRLQMRIRTPICLDESFSSFDSVSSAVEFKASRIVNVRPGNLGGLAEAVRVHDHCVSLGVPLWHGGAQESGIGRATNLAVASLAGFTLPSDIPASGRYFEKDITRTQFTLEKDGTIKVPSGLGIGVEIDEKELAAVTTFREDFK